MPPPTDAAVHGGGGAARHLGLWGQISSFQYFFKETQLEDPRKIQSQSVGAGQQVSIREATKARAHYDSTTKPPLSDLTWLIQCRYMQRMVKWAAQPESARITYWCSRDRRAIPHSEPPLICHSTEKGGGEVVNGNAHFVRVPMPSGVSPDMPFRSFQEGGGTHFARVHISIVQIFP